MSVLWFFFYKGSVRSVTGRPLASSFGVQRQNGLQVEFEGGAGVGDAKALQCLGMKHAKDTDFFAVDMPVDGAFERTTSWRISKRTTGHQAKQTPHD